MTEEVFATPAAQAHADEAGIDLADVEGTGSDGKITKADVVQYLGPEEHPSQQLTEPVQVAKSREQRALDLLGTIRAHGMNQIYSNEIDRILHEPVK